MFAKVKMIIQRLLDWFRTHFVFSKTILFIWGLIFTHGLVEYAVVSVMIVYFHDIYEHQPNLLRDAMAVNLLDGGSAVLVVLVTHVSEAYTGYFNMIILCTSAYVMGLMLLWITYWSDAEVDMLYVALLLIALGKAGKDPPLYSFLGFQLKEKVKQSLVYINREIEEERNDIRINIWWRTAWISGAAIVLFYLGNATWLKIFKVSALLMGGTHLLFYLGFIFYQYERPVGSSPLTSIYRVFRAAIKKLNFEFPDSAEKYYWKDEEPTGLSPRRNGTQLHLSPHVPSLFRFLDKAAIIREESDLSQQQQEKNGELCTVKEVKEVKHIVPAVYLGLIFLAYSLVAACGTTYFLKQQSNLNKKIGKFTLPDSFLFIFKSFVRDVVILIFWWFGLTQHQMTSLRIGAGLFCAVLCCITAWQVELHRLGLIKKEGVLENPDKTLSLGIWVLFPQYFLLGLMEGLAEKGFQKFFHSHVPKSLQDFGKPFSGMVLGFGKFFSIPFVLIFSSWFKETINTSHLDKYFLMLGILCFLFFCIYVYYSWRYNLMKDYSEEQESVTDMETSEAIQEALQDQFDQVQQLKYPRRSRSNKAGIVSRSHSSKI